MPAPLTILTCYYRPKPGGLCRRYFRGIEALLARGHTVHYLAVVPFPITHARCIAHRFPWPQNATQGLVFWTLFHLLAPLQLLWLSARYRVDRLYSFSINYAWMLKPAARLRGLRNRVFLRADVLRNEELKGRHLSRLLGRRFEASALSGASVCAVAQDLLDQLSRRHPHLLLADAQVFPNDLPKLPPAQHLRTPPYRLASVGILEERKNPALLLQALDAVHSPVHLSFYGSGPLLAALRQRTQHDPRVTLQGWADPATLWSEIDLLLMPSRHEGAPNAVLEALAQGIPVLASDIPAHREILPTYQLLSPDDADLWARSIDRLVEDAALLRRWRDDQAATAMRLRFDWNQSFCSIIEADTPLRGAT